MDVQVSHLLKRTTHVFALLEVIYTKWTMSGHSPRNVPLHSCTMSVGFKPINNDFLDKHIALIPGLSVLASQVVIYQYGTNKKMRVAGMKRVTRKD